MDFAAKVLLFHTCERDEHTTLVIAFSGQKCLPTVACRSSLRPFIGAAVLACLVSNHFCDCTSTDMVVCRKTSA